MNHTGNRNSGSLSWLSVQPSIVRDLPTILWDGIYQPPHLGDVTQLVDCLPSMVRIPAQEPPPDRPFLLITTSARECRGPSAHFLDEAVRVEASHRPIPSHISLPAHPEEIAGVRSRKGAQGHLRDHQGGGWR